MRLRRIFVSCFLLPVPAPCSLFHSYPLASALGPWTLSYAYISTIHVLSLACPYFYRVSRSFRSFFVFFTFFFFFYYYFYYCFYFLVDTSCYSLTVNSSRDGYWDHQTKSRYLNKELSSYGHHLWETCNSEQFRVGMYVYMYM